jgi:hypothetical protein
LNALLADKRMSPGMNSSIQVPYIVVNGHSERRLRYAIRIMKARTCIFSLERSDSVNVDSCGRISALRWRSFWERCICEGNNVRPVT